MPDSFQWLDVDRIAEELADHHPDTHPLDVNFVDLRGLIERLDGFAPETEHPVNERILEAIQAQWLEEFDGVEIDDD